MNLTVFPGTSLQGTVHSQGQYALPGDKSLSHRAGILAALAQGESVVDNFQVSGVTRAMLEALTLLGISWELAGHQLRVHGKGLHGFQESSQAIHCGNSATTIRLLAGALAASGTPAILDGSFGLRRRPMERIVAPLRQMGVDIRSTDGCAPLVLGRSSMPLKALDYTLPVSSAQVKTCLLLAALAADGITILREPGPSRDHTERMLRSMGIIIESARDHAMGGDGSEKDQYLTILEPPQPGTSLAPLQIQLPGDPSAAAFLIVAALITPGSHLILDGVLLNSTRTGLLDVLQSMGAKLEWEIAGEPSGEPVGKITVHYSPLKSTQVSGTLVVRMIDEFPAFAVAAACAQGRTVVRDASELRTKESDRISALAGELRKLGIRIDETEDGFEIEGGGQFHGAVVQPHGDHRLAMALAVAGLAAENPLTVQDSQIIEESFPAFSAILQRLGGQLESEV